MAAFFIALLVCSMFFTFDSYLLPQPLNLVISRRELAIKCNICAIFLQLKFFCKKMVDERKEKQFNSARLQDTSR